MTTNNRVVLSSDHSAIELRQAIAEHIVAHGWTVVNIGPTTKESTDYPKHGEAAARMITSRDCRFGIVLCGTDQGIMMAANKIAGIRWGMLRHLLSPHDPPAQRRQHVVHRRPRGRPRPGP